MELDVVGDQELGLPTTREEELILALLKVTNAWNGFKDERVYFHQSELLRELEWATDGRGYKRLDRAFATVNSARYRINGWRDNAEKVYTSKGAFQLISDYELRDARRRRVGSKKKGESSLNTLSYFYWGPVLFKSFRSGYLKKLDHELVKQFKEAASPRIYRFLDKVVNPPEFDRVVEDLKNFAYEHMAVPRKADLTGIKRRLEPAIAELTAHGCLVAMPWMERIRQKVNGERQIVFEVPAAKAPIEVRTSTGEANENEELRRILTERGVSEPNVKLFSTTRTRERIESDVAHVDYLQGQGQIKKSKGGLLTKMLQSDTAWERPKELVRKADSAAARERNAAVAEKNGRIQEARNRASANGPKSRTENSSGFYRVTPRRT